jgi:hypothetical protein
MVYHGSNRQYLSAEFQDSDIVLTTYETMRADCMNGGPLSTAKWYRLVMDEG